MKTKGKFLILGATGAMGIYLTEVAAEGGFDVDAVSLDDAPATYPNVHPIRVGDATAPAFIEEAAARHYDIVVDFMSYRTAKFRSIVPIYLKNVGRYVYLSSCRVFANEENPIVETSPRLIDVTTDQRLILSDDYCMYKAREENALRAGKFRNWTIVRPSTTYSKKRCQLVTLERDIILRCLRAGKPVLLPEEARNIPASLTWGGDVAQMIFRLAVLPEAAGEDYNVTTSEALTWQQIADIYHDVFGLEHKWVTEEEYYRFKKPDYDPENDLWMIWQLRYARLFNRVYDNTKMLSATGLKQSEFLSLRDGLAHEKKTILEGD